MPNPKLDLDLDAIDAAAARGHALDFPATRVSNALDGLIDAVEAVFKWIWVVLILLIVVNVALRYLVGTNFVALEEMQWHLYAIGFMLGIGYALQADGHVRVDVMAERFRPRTRAWIELLGLVLFVFPLIGIILAYGFPFVQRAYRIGEVSSAPGGLPYRWLIKSVILVAFVYLGLAALSRLLRVLSFLFGWPASRLR